MNIILVKSSPLDGLISAPQKMGEGTLKYILVNPVANSSRTHPRISRSGVEYKKLRLSQLVKYFGQVQQGDTVIIENHIDLLAHQWAAISVNPAGNYSPLISVSAMRNLYISIIEGLRSLGAAPVLVSLPHVNPSRYLHNLSQGLDQENIRRWMGWDPSTLIQIQEQYNRDLLSLAEEYQVPVVDLSAILSSIPNMLASDGYSLSEEGQRIVDETIAAIRL